MQKAMEYISRYQMIAEGDRIIAGVSGGADSICLLYTLLEYRKQKYFQIKVVHIEHGIRGKSSLSDAAYVENLCKKEGIPCICYHRNVPELAARKKLTLEEAGRLCRYQAFEETARSWGGAKIAVAHNQNDQAETMLWNMVRGSGLLGLTGIRPVREQIIRPLLCCSRSEIEEYLRQKGIAWCEDETNQGEDYTRNIIRNRILPVMKDSLNASAVRHMAMLGEEVGRAETYLEQITREKYQKCVSQEEKQVSILISRFLEEAEYIRERIVRYALSQIGCGLKDITREHIKEILSLTGMQSGKCRNLPGGWIAAREFDRIVIFKKREEAEYGQTELVLDGNTETATGIFTTRIFDYDNQEIPQNRYTKWLNYDKMNSTLMVRNRKPGDFLVINREGGKKKLKSYLTDQKIPVSEKDRILLLCMGQEVLWVVGYRLSEAWKVGADTKRILEIEYKEVQNHGRTD